MGKTDKRAIARNRDKLIKSFPDRELVVMTNPMGDGAEDDPGELNSIALDKDFEDTCRHLRIKLINDTPLKQIWSRTITGPTFVFLLIEYIQHLNEKGGIRFSEVWEFYIESELQRIYEESLQEVGRKINDHMWGEDDETPAKQHSDDDDDAIQYQKLPWHRQDVMFFFDKLRSDIIMKFDPLLQLANTRAERNYISLKMEEIEKVILQRLRPFDQKNKVESQRHLLNLDNRLFQNIREGVSQNKSKLVTFNLGQEIQAYLAAMEDNDEWKRVSDSENV